MDSWPGKVAVGALVAQRRGSAGRMLADCADFHGTRAGRPLILFRQLAKTVDSQIKMLLSDAMVEIRDGALEVAPWLTGVYVEGDELWPNQGIGADDAQMPDRIRSRCDWCG